MANDAFEKLKSSVNRGITTISVKTSSSLEKSKIKTHIDSLQRDIEKIYASLGESLYMEWLQEEINHDVFAERLETVKVKKAEIEELYAQLAAIDERDNQILGNAGEKNSLVCAKCGTKYDSPVKFCGKCGNKMD